MAIGRSRSEILFSREIIGSDPEIGAEDKKGLELESTRIGEELPEIFKEPLFGVSN